jgi:hypothetical protein
MTEDYSDLPKSATLAPPPRNPSETERLTIAQMQAIMRERFGEPERWSFVCPACGLVQCPADVDAAGLGPYAKGYIGRICLNVYRAQDDPQRCTWTALGLQGAPLSVTQATIAGDTLRPSMPIAPAPAPGGSGG